MSADDAYDSSHITQWLLETDSLEDFLQTLADAALELSHVEGTGLTLERDGRPLTVVSAGTAAPKLDEKQYGQDDGPCLQSLRTGEEIRVDDMSEETRWGDYPAYAAACGVRSSLSLPIAAHTHTAGALTCTAPRPVPSNRPTISPPCAPWPRRQPAPSRWRSASPTLRNSPTSSKRPCATAASSTRPSA